jgi:peptidoglycan/xylan/chitin deacetylase (PgdA/CDA1 family)
MGASLRRVARSPLIDPLLTAVVAVLELGGRRGPLDVAVLTYHRVDERGARPYLYPGLISATPDTFEAQLRELARRANPIGVDELRSALRRDRRLPDRPVLVTIDDAYEDFAEHAWPRLRRLGIPATLFVPTAYPGSPSRRFWWDRLSHALSTTDRPSFEVGGVTYDLDGEAARLAAFRQLRALIKATPHEGAMAMIDAWCEALGLPDAPSGILDWGALRSLAAEGVTIAPHTRTHPLLTRVDSDRLVAEVDGSRVDLEREIGAVPPVFAYPSGAHDDAVVHALGTLGLELAFTTVRGLVDLRRPDPLRLRRINIGGGTSLAALRLQLIRGVGAPLTMLDGD